MARAVLIFALLALTPSLAHAESGAVWEGVWQGQLGTQPVRVCLTKRESWSFGAYYYLKHLTPIPLRQIENSKSWVEGSSAPKDSSKPRWDFETISESILTAAWKANGKSVPIRLTRMSALAAAEQPCGSDIFNAPRVKGGHIVSKQARLDGRTYTNLTYVPGPQFQASRSIASH